MQSRNLIDAVRLAHGGLDVQSLDVLPVLLEEGHKEVDRNHDVGVHLVVRHLDVRSGDTEGQHLLELELDSGTDAVNLLDDVLTVLEQGRELTELVHGRSKQTGDLLKDGLGSKEEAVLAGKLLDLLLVLVEGLEGLNVHARDASGLGGLDVLGITKDAARETRAGHVGQLDRTSETLVLLRVIVLQHNLELDGLAELALLGRGLIEDGLDGFLKGLCWDFAHIDSGTPVSGE